MPVYKKVNKDFFKKWSGNMAYILGFICADGNLIKNKRGAHFFAIYTLDKELLLKMRKCLESEHKISSRKSIGKLNFGLQIGSKEMFIDLNKLGIFPDKTKRLMLPKIRVKYQKDFIRGYFDGDGNVWVGLIHKDRQKPFLVIRAVFTSCSRNFLMGVRDILLKRLKMNGVISEGKGNFYRLTYSIKGALNLYKFMYNSTHSFLELKRKKAVFEKYIKTKNLRV